MRVLAPALGLLLLAATSRAEEPRDSTLAASEVLLRYIAISNPSDDKLCITIDGLEIPPALLQRLEGTGLRIASCTQGWTMRIPIGKPAIQADGTYLMSYGYYMACEGCVQGKAMFAFLRKDAAGWSVLRIQGGVNF